MYLLQEMVNFPGHTQLGYKLASVAADLCTEYVVGPGDQATLKFDISISFENKVTLW